MKIRINFILVLSMLAIMIIPGIASADVYVRGYTRKNGTYVKPHYRSDPDSSKLNNWSTIGNVNPHTGKPGTVDPYKNSSPSSSSPYKYSAPAKTSTSTPNYKPTNNVVSSPQTENTQGSVLGDKTNSVSNNNSVSPTAQLPNSEPPVTPTDTNDNSSLPILGLIAIGGGIATIWKRQKNKRVLKEREEVA